jgi:hypothetical protein
MNFGAKYRTTFRAFATRAVSEVVKASVTALASATLPFPALGILLGTVSKDLVDTFSARSSEVESKLDRLIREPLQTGLRLMRQGLIHDQNTREEKEARNALFDSAHVALTRAWVLVGDSREDATFIRALDCIALAAHGYHRSVARDELASLDSDLRQMRLRVRLLQEEADRVRTSSEHFDRFLARDSLRDKPFGHMEQRLAGRSKRNSAVKISLKAEKARNRLELLEGLASIASRFVEYLENAA